MELRQVFMVNMKKYRKQAGFTQERLAELCNTDPCYVRQIESGRRFPSVAYIERIAGALRIAPYQLFFTEIEEETHSIAEKSQKELIKKTLIEKVSQSIALVIDDLP